MTAAEIKAEEDTVKLLATFLNEKSIPNLVQDLKQQDGLPFDSASLQDFFHKRGVNMRYLGKVLQNIDKYPEQPEENNPESPNVHLLQMAGEYKHVKTLLEREIFLRSAKHVVNQILRDERGEGDMHLAQCISHLLNCLLAPIPFIQAMNSGKIRPEDSSVQTTFQFFPEESIPSPRKNSMSADKPPAAEESEAKVSSFEAPSTATSTQAASQQPEQMTKK